MASKTPHPVLDALALANEQERDGGLPSTSFLVARRCRALGFEITDSAVRRILSQFHVGGYVVKRFHHPDPAKGVGHGNSYVLRERPPASVVNAPRPSARYA